MKPQSKLVLCIVLLSLMVLCIVLLALSAYWMSKRRANTAVIGANVCSECEGLLTRREIATGTLETIERLMSTDNNKICCGDAEEVLKLAARKYVIDIFQEQLIGSVPVDTLCEHHDMPDIPQGLIVGVIQFRPTHSKGFHLLLWNKNTRTRTSGGLQHLEEEGEVFIRKRGKYFVSARLNLQYNSSSVVSVGDSVVSVGDSVVSVGDSVVSVEDVVTLRMSVLSHELGYSRVVLETKTSLRDETPVQFGALFDFYEFDRLSLSISHPSLVVLNRNDDQFMATYHPS